MDDTMIYYRGFSPDESTRQLFQAFIRQIQDLAPTSSFIRASISHNGLGYRGAVKINSMIGHFHTYGHAKDLPSLRNQLHRSLCDQLSHWKASRFDEAAEA